MAKDQALRIIDSLGADNITAELKLSRHSVRAARLKGALPGKVVALRADMEFLQRLWASIQEKARTARAGSKVLMDTDLALA